MASILLGNHKINCCGHAYNLPAEGCEGSPPRFDTPKALADGAYPQLERFQ